MCNGGRSSMACDGSRRPAMPDLPAQHPPRRSPAPASPARGASRARIVLGCRSCVDCDQRRPVLAFPGSRGEDPDRCRGLACCNDTRNAYLHRRAALPRHEPEQGPGILRGRHHRGDPQCTCAHPRPERDGAHFGFRLQGQGREPSRGRPDTAASNTSWRAASARTATSCGSRRSSSTRARTRIFGLGPGTGRCRTVFKVQEEIARAVADALAISLGVGDLAQQCRA